MTDRSIVDNFDHLSRLARDNPEAFEQWRQQLLDELISGLTPDRQDKLRRLQWRIDQENRRSDSSLGRCIRLTSMMWERLNTLQNHVELVCDLYQGRKGSDHVVRSSQSCVLPFEKKVG